MLYLKTTPATVEFWTDFERICTKLSLPNWRYHRGIWLDRLGKRQSRLPHPKVRPGNIPNTSQKRCAKASVRYIRYLQHNRQCPKNRAISIARVINTPWKQLWNYTVIEEDWNLIIHYSISKLIGGKFQAILDFQIPVVETYIIRRM